MAPHPTKSHKCHKCGETEGEEKHRLCGRCKAVRYCSRDCQAADWAHHRQSCKPKNYLLKVHLCPDVVKDPAVTRVLSCPATARFADLHKALQVAFQWASTHLYEFSVHSEYRSPLSLEPLTAKKISRKLRLYQVFGDPQYNGHTFEYLYDFGDNWNHIITVQGRADATDKFSCVGGTGHYVAEDVMQPGWQDLKEAYKAENPDESQREQMDWFENRASNGDPLGLGNGREHIWDKDFVNVGLGMIHVAI